MVCLFLCQFHTVVTTSAKTLPTPSPGTYSDLIPSCQPFSCSQGFGAPDCLPSTLPSLHFPKEPGVQESQSRCGRGSPGPCWSEAQIPTDLSTPTCCRAGVMRRSATAPVSEGSGRGQRCLGWFNFSACNGTLPWPSWSPGRLQDKASQSWVASKDIWCYKQNRILSKFISKGPLEAVTECSLNLYRESVTVLLGPPLWGGERRRKEQSPSEWGWLACTWAHRLSLTTCRAVWSPWLSVPREPCTSVCFLRARGMGREWEVGRADLSTNLLLSNVRWVRSHPPTSSL